MMENKITAGLIQKYKTGCWSILISVGPYQLYSSFTFFAP